MVSIDRPEGAVYPAPKKHAVMDQKGEVFIPHHGYLARRAGKRPQAHTLGMDNLFLDDQGPARMELGKEMLLALREQHFAAVIVESDQRFLRAIRMGY